MYWEILEPRCPMFPERGKKCSYVILETSSERTCTADEFL